MGGEPDEEMEEVANCSFSAGLTSYKAPVLISHPIEADEEVEEPPVVEPLYQQQQHSSELHAHQQESGADDEKGEEEDPSYRGKVQVVQSGLNTMQICTPVTSAAFNTLKVPSVHGENRFKQF